MIDGSIKRQKVGALCLALLLACAVLLQFTLGAFAAGAMTSGPQRDIFGNLLCLSEGGEHNRTADHGAVPACCSAGCLFASIASAPPPQHGWVSPVLIAARLEQGFAATPIRLTNDLYAHRPRGPPISA
ncbi:hypothetical protein JYU29_00335 [Tianweitania sp. BSSL-BM11]|uniref:DUF2946 domain-containing protein n=1 Tax=Tianweitania aestuarii TaxID=2814886 RepID=A0ABS5RQ20_9HYPH|nr:hypothetical protein [Tianweitania aestuarii]MBS9719128.1 hypothetical protein [Tianweitania aestuarii]